jgi:hypothetical protein
MSRRRRRPIPAAGGYTPITRQRLCGTFGPWVVGYTADVAPDVIARLLLVGSS